MGACSPKVAAISISKFLLVTAGKRAGRQKEVPDVVSIGHVIEVLLGEMLYKEILSSLSSLSVKVSKPSF